MSIEIIPIDTSDLDCVASLFDQYRQFYKLKSDLPAVRDFLFDRLSRQEALIYVAYEAEDSNKKAAVGFMLLYPSFSSLGLSPILYLNDLYVLPQARRSGIANQLVNHAKDLAREFGYSKIILETASTNTPAKNLYESLGYTQENQYDQYYITVD